MTGIIFNIQHFSVHDGPGIRTTVFLKGCPFHCPWCHNPESILQSSEIVLRADRCIRCGDCIKVCQNDAISEENGFYTTNRVLCKKCGECVNMCVSDARIVAGDEMSVEEVIKEVRKDIAFYHQSGGGVTFSGGEPLFQHEFLLCLLKAARKEGIHTTVDTTGFAKASILQSIAKHTNLFLYDVKMLDDAKHREFTGVSNARVLENLRLLIEWKKKVIVRVPIIPAVNDDEESIRSLGEFICSLQSIPEIHLLPYHQSGVEKYQRMGAAYTMTSIAVPHRESLESIQQKLRSYVPQVQVTIGG